MRHISYTEKILFSDWLDDWSELLPICPYKNSIYYMGHFMTHTYSSTCVRRENQQKWNIRHNARNARTFGR